MKRLYALLLAMISLGAAGTARAQTQITLDLARGGIAIGTIGSGSSAVTMPGATPLFTAEVNDTVVSSLAFAAAERGDSLTWELAEKHLSGSVKIDRAFTRGWKAVITIRNTAGWKQVISGVVPMGESKDNVYIKAAGPSDYVHRLSRSQLFRPGVGAVGVILPDNAWELGFCDIRLDANRSLCAIARRTSSDSAEARRFRTILSPGGSVSYTFYADTHAGGTWQEGLRLMFRDRWIYDLDRFDNALFEREDLEWIRHSYLLLLQFAWEIME